MRDLYDDILLSGDTPDINGRVDSLLRKERVLNALMQKTIDISAAAAALDMDPSSPLTLTRVFVKNAVHPLPELDMQEMSYRYLKYVIDPIHIPTKEGSSLYAGKAVASSRREDIRHIAETFRDALTAASGGIISVVVYEENCTLTTLKDIVQRICQTEMPSDGITVCPLPPEKRSLDTLAQLDLSRRMARVKDMELLLARGEREKYLSAFDQAVADLSGSEDCSLIYMAIALQLLEYIRKNALTDSLPESLSLSKLRSPEEPIDWKSAYAYARNAASVIFQTKPAADPEDSMLLLIDHIEKHLDEALSLPELAELVHYNPSYLSRTFKHRVGVNLNQYILQARIQKACALLKNGGRVNDVAVKVGFRDVRYFSEMFRKQTGKTPQEYRLNK